MLEIFLPQVGLFSTPRVKADTLCLQTSVFDRAANVEPFSYGKTCVVHRQSCVTLSSQELLVHILVTHSVESQYHFDLQVLFNYGQVWPDMAENEYSTDSPRSNSDGSIKFPPGHVIPSLVDTFVPVFRCRMVPLGSMDHVMHTEFSVSTSSTSSLGLFCIKCCHRTFESHSSQLASGIFMNFPGRMIWCKMLKFCHLRCYCSQKTSYLAAWLITWLQWFWSVFGHLGTGKSNEINTSVLAITSHHHTIGPDVFLMCIGVSSGKPITEGFLKPVHPLMALDALLTGTATCANQLLICTGRSLATVWPLM